MAYMRHALLRAEGFIVITGQPGMGKTTLINDLFRGLRPDQIRIARLVSTQLLADDLLRLVAFELDLDPAGLDKASVLNRVGNFLRQQHREGRRTLLVVDEAQDVTGEALEELRLLTNIQVDGQQLLQIFLVGQEELRDTVSAPTLVQLHQRVIAAAHIEPLNVTETKEYIKHRLRRVGWEGDPLISNQAYSMIHHFSRGIPRQINQICSRLLLHGSIEERHRLGLQDLKIVIEELYGEMLLPLGMQEIADTVVWPSDVQRETYDDSPQPRTAPPAVAASPDQPAAIQPRPIPAGSADNPGGHITAGTPPAARATASTAVPTDTPDKNQPDNFNRPASTTVDHSHNEHRKRKRGPLLMLAAVVLLAGLLVLLMTLNPETGSRLRDQLAALIDIYNREQINSMAAPEPPSLKPSLSRLEADLAGNGLVVESLKDGSLKINLSNEELFDLNSTEISANARTVLEKLAGILSKHDKNPIHIVGHTDSSGEAGFNLALSQVRAKAVADYLVTQGLQGERIWSEGRGDRDTRLEAPTRNRPDLRRRVDVYIRPIE
jgi:type II secretory pathway predicted ATPase ExeA/outer membrane protein OmpA-like peptidoglycan-associated protein